jgi:putative inorganic carbon (HCO3(-)) transporter
VWLSTIQILRNYWLFGVGPGNDTFEKIYPFYMTSSFSALGAYSVPLEVWAEQGIVGLVSFLFLIFFFSKALLKRLEKEPLLIGVLGSFSGLLAHGLVDTIWYRPPVHLLWWFTLALIYNMRNEGICSEK